MESSYLRAAMALSAAGMVLVPVFGLLLRFQPAFVHGLRVSSSSAEVNCYIVGGLYAGVFLVCGLLLALRTRGCFDNEQDVTQDGITRRNQRYGLRFVELESKEFTLELPTKFPTKADSV
ncbi:hypothetical protein PHYSODRAFT_475825 [Phytophthora sojae]|uniref:Transmembrane protein n=1 Tax=Phytophthora sojae (strain P6497) TaxID=1094619 RepID=G4YEJ4_PHYSP|nr:hypothetical protein PHYSODRAFT_475825 [Phytophthora sojae]EGZ27271.1 hypothetical protein PHYSODRAFT_475825 [Phytophthora sojae]|eukprot:XP_009514546.1 hypothetical protein PHYSODRAFT_475825 [Phytophthora sojae]